MKKKREQLIRELNMLSKKLLQLESTTHPIINVKLVIGGKSKWHIRDDKVFLNDLQVLFDKKLPVNKIIVGKDLYFKFYFLAEHDAFLKARQFRAEYKASLAKNGFKLIRSEKK